MKRIAILLVGFLVLTSDFTASAQEKDQVAQDSDSLHPNPVPKENVLIQHEIWRQIDLKEKANKPFFPHKEEITKFIIDGVAAGRLTSYSDEACTKPMTQEEFLEKLKLPEADNLSGEDKALGFTDDDDWGDDNQQDKNTTQESAAECFLPNEVSILRIREYWKFDKVRSIQVYEIQSIGLIIPAHKFETGLEREVAMFKYKDLAAYFDESGVEWMNVHNSAGNIKMTEAFELRLFSSRIYKMENPDDNTIADIYNKTPKAHLEASKKLEEKLLEEEYFLWEP